MQAEADLALAIDDYNGTIDEMKDAVQVLAIQHASALDAVEDEQEAKSKLETTALKIARLKSSSLGLLEGVELAGGLDRSTGGLRS